MINAQKIKFKLCDNVYWLLKVQNKSPSHDSLGIVEWWHPIGDSNPCYRRERAVS